MSILTISNLTQSYGDFDVFVGISATIPNDGKVGLVGPNGIGKTSLLRILAGLDVPSEGSVNLAQGARIGYLRQEAMDAFAGDDNTVHSEMLTVFAELRDREVELREIEQRMADGDTSETLFATYSRIQEKFERAGGYDYELRIGQVLQGLGFSREDWDTPLAHLSGGQKTRALLARLLLEEPDLLILDEPTNHLDVEAIEWLEGVLRTWPGAILIVSHDRFFLDTVANRIWEMSRGGIESYRGNYSAYVTQRLERWERREAEFEAVRERFLKELDYVKRNIARDSTTNMAKGRLRRLIREVRVVQSGRLHSLQTKNWGQVIDEGRISSTKWNVMDVEQAIKGLRSPVERPPQLNLNLHTTMRSGELVLRSGELVIGYPDAPLFRCDPIDLRRKECAALIGPNGTGKTTFLRTLMEQMDPLQGELRLGASLKLGYFAQAHDRLNPENTVLDELIGHKHMLLGPARTYLAQYLFREEDVFKPISTLSGGERGRLALAILALEGANFLLLDEPTNHLDIPAQEILQDVLEHFDGTILLVSHDRYLVDHLATQIWSLQDGEMTVYEGSYAGFLNARVRAKDVARAETVVQRSDSRADQRSERARKNQERKRAQALAKHEDEIHGMEDRLVKLEEEMAAAGLEQDLTRLHRLSDEHTRLQKTLEQAMDLWAELAEA